MDTICKFDVCLPCFYGLGRWLRRGQGRGTSVIFALDKFNAAFKSLSACQPVWCCLIDIYICALCKGFRIYIVWHREREKNTHIKKQKYCLMMNVVRVRVYVRSSPPSSTLFLFFATASLAGISVSASDSKEKRNTKYKLNVYSTQTFECPC